jgi:hypothetical protein
MTDSEYRKELRQQHKSSGLCINCDKPAVDGKAQCLYHLQRAKIKQERRKQRRIKNGICTACNTNQARENKTTCESCRKKASIRYFAQSDTYKTIAKHNYQQRYPTLRRAAYLAYGGFRCTCCGESNEMFLSLDHIDGKGAEHRRQLKSKGGERLYTWLRDNNYPPGFQVLCMNCNFGKQRNGGQCPHKDISNAVPSLSIV